MMLAIVIKKFTNARHKNVPGLVFVVGWPTLYGVVGTFVVPIDVGTFVI